MCEKSAAGGSRKDAIRDVTGLLPPVAPGRAPAPVAAPGAAAPGAPPAVGEKVEPRPGFPPIRPPDRLRKPSTLSLKQSVRMSRLEVAPPCEWPASQKALMFSLPTCSTTKLTMFFKYSSSASVHTLVGEFGVATTRRYLST